MCSWNQLKSCFGANKACCVMALSKVLAAEILILIRSPGSNGLSEHLTPALCALGGARATWWLGQVWLLKPQDSHAVTDCSGAVMLKMSYEWEVTPKILWLDVEMITRKALALVYAAKEGQKSKGRTAPRLHVTLIRNWFNVRRGKGEWPKCQQLWIGNA